VRHLTGLTPTTPFRIQHSAFHIQTMPTFPTYYGPPLPKVLNPLSPAHYWLVFKWVFFQPNRFKHYLYQIDPDLYRATGLRSLLKTLRLPAYRNLYVIALITSLLAALGVACAASAAQASPLRWSGLLLGVAFGVAVGVALGVAGGVAVGVAGGVAGGVAVGVAVGVVGGVVGGVTVGMAYGVAVGVAYGVAFGVAFGVAGSVAGGVAVGMAFGVVGGVAVGMVFGVAGGVAVGVTFGVTFGVAVGVAFGVTLVIGASRLLFWPFELLWVGLARLPGRNRSPRLSNHPAVWDELAVWPLPGLGSLLRQQLDSDFEAALRVIVKVSANPFQRWAMQRALLDWQGSHSNPLITLRQIASQPSLAGYIILPVSKAQARNFPGANVILFGEMGQQFTDTTGGYTATVERLVWQLTRSLRRMQPTPLSRFSAMLYMTLFVQAQPGETGTFEFSLAKRFHGIFESVRVYPHGDEVADSWNSLTAFLEITTVEVIGMAYEWLAWIPRLEQPYLAPEIIGALTALGDISRSVAVSLQATSLPNKTVALNQAAGGLQELFGYVQKELWPPEKALYMALIKNWQALVNAEQGRLGESALRQMSPGERLATGLIDRMSDVWQRPAKPLDNPYIAGDPVMPPLFVGRRDIFTRINEIWHAKKNPDSIILYGHRRMGKSSILRNLDQAAPGRAIAYVNLQGETSFVASTADLLLALADRIYAEVRRARPNLALNQPPADRFTTPASAQIHFNRFMEDVRAALGETGLILALDEFEAIEDAVRDGKVGKEIYQFLRAKTQEPWITVVFGGLHRLDEMSRDYAQPFYGSYQNIVVSYLAPEDARRLVTNPTPDFKVNYEAAAVERIIAATGGQPYLVQLVCRDALDHVNHELFDEHQEREVKITSADVDTALSDNLFRHGTGYFDGVWSQVSEAMQQNLLRVMAQRESPWTLEELIVAAALSPDEVRHQLELAARRDILRANNGAWEFCVPLMRRWIVWKE
jgi:hypothetical protein